MAESRPKGPQPGMSQEEKDAAGERVRLFLERQERRNEAAMREATWTADDALDRLDDDALAAEADLRGVEAGGRNRNALIKALKGARYRE